MKDSNTNNSERRNYYRPANSDRTTFKKHERRPYVPYSTKPRLDDFTLFNTRLERILKEIYHSKLIPDAPAPRGPNMGTHWDGWCRYHMIRGHDTDSCIHLRQEIEKLIQSGKLRGYTKETKGEDKRKSERDQKARKEGHNEEQRHTLHTISGGFAGGGESSSSCKKYVRQVMLCQEDNNHALEREPDITFSPKDYQDIVSHDDDPTVITLQIFKWDVKRVLIDPGSLADILYYETFERMGLDSEQLQPFKGTLAGFTGEQVQNSF